MRYRIDLKREREKRNMTQAQLAELIGITEKSVSKWESGRGQPSYENMLKICKEFNIDINKIDNAVITKRKTNIVLNSCLALANLIIVIILLFQLNKMKNIDYLANNLNMIEHLNIYENLYRIDTNRFYFEMSLFIFVPTLTVVLPFMLKKHIVLSSFISILNVSYCIIVFKNIKVYEILNYMIVLCCMFGIIAVLFIDYKIKKLERKHL